MKLLSCIAVLSLTLFSGSSFAQSAEQELRELLTQYQGFSADFKQKVTDSEGTLINQADGELKFKQPGKFVWQVVNPEQEALISDGSTLWWLNEFIEQVSIFDASESVAKTPFALLVSNDDKTWQRFEITKSDHQYTIAPINKDDAQVLQLQIEFGQSGLQQIVILDRTRQKSEYRLSNQAFGLVDDKFFSVDIPLGFDVDDQRHGSAISEGNVQY